MRYLSFFLVAYLFTGVLSCSEHDFNSELLKKNTNSDEGIIVSCIRCNCVIEELTDYYKSNKNIESKIQLYADTNCLKPFSKKKINFLSQKVLDSVYEKNYNLILFKRDRDKYDYKLVKTEDALKFMQIAKAFFD